MEKIFKNRDELKNISKPLPMEDKKIKSEVLKICEEHGNKIPCDICYEKNTRGKRIGW